MLSKQYIITFKTHLGIQQIQKESSFTSPGELKKSFESATKEENKITGLNIKVLKVEEVN